MDIILSQMNPLSTFTPDFFKTFLCHPPNYVFVSHVVSYLDASVPKFCSASLPPSFTFPSMSTLNSASHAAYRHVIMKPTTLPEINYKNTISQGISITTLRGYESEDRGSILGRYKGFIVFSTSRPALGPTYPSIQ